MGHDGAIAQADIAAVAAVVAMKAAPLWPFFTGQDRQACWALKGFLEIMSYSMAKWTLLLPPVELLRDSSKIE